MTAIKLIVGLGNPGSEHVNDRHNVGFWFIDRLCAAQRVATRHERKFHGEVGRLTQHAHELWLLKPATYMNRSGLAVLALALYYKILPSEILVVYDELDLPPGTAKLKQGGGASGHNGIKDIIAHLTTPDFWRLRVGIGHPGEKSQVVDYVLHAPGKAERESIETTLERALALLPYAIRGDFAKAMLQLHTKPKQAKTENQGGS